MATRGEKCNDWHRTVMTGGCLLVAFAPDGATGNDDEYTNSTTWRKYVLKNTCTCTPGDYPGSHSIL